MDFEEDPDKARDIALKAIQMMMEQKIAPNPVNFTICYLFLSGGVPELVAEVTREMDDHGALTAERAAELFESYVRGEHLRATARAQAGVQAILAQLIVQSGKTADHARDYGNLLERSLEYLDGAHRDPPLENVLGELNEKTRQTVQVTDTFENKLNSARSEIDALKAELEASRHAALHDSLTGFDNRLAFDLALDESIGSGEVEASFSLLLVDVDHFTNLGEGRGCTIPDEVLYEISRIIDEAIPKGHCVARYDRDTFVILLRGIDTKAAHRRAEGIRETVSRLRLRQKGSRRPVAKVSVSIGVARHQPGENSQSFMERATLALRAAKENGRNQSVIL